MDNITKTKRFYKKKTYKKPKITAKKAYNLAKSLKTAEELKQFFSSGGPANVDSTGTTIGSAVSQGIQAYERIGDSILIKKFRMNGYFYRNNADAICRIIVLRDKSNNVTAGSSVLETVGSTIAPFSGYAVDNDENFTVFYDQKFVITSNEPLQVFDISLKMNMKQTYEDGAGANVVTNDLIVLFISSAAANLPQYTYYKQIYYNDA